MRTPGAVSRSLLSVIWLPVGVLLILVPIVLVQASWSTYLHGHPSMLIVALACIIAGVVAIGWAAGSLILGRKVDAEQRNRAGRRLTTQQLERRAAWRITLAVPALILSLVAVGGLIWAQPMPAGPAAEEAMVTSETVRVTDRLTWFEMVPAKRDQYNNVVPPTGGLVFVPGARVDARAYAPILRPLAEAGYLVVVLKEPFGIANPRSAHAEDVLRLHPDVPFWAMGGHSLGGVAASEFADSHPIEISGLLLYASYPSDPVTRTELKVLSISGDQDGLTTPEKIEASKANLPKGSTFQVVKGATHAQFGDYGEQPGDGQPQVDRAKAQAAIVKGTTAFLASLKPKQ